MASTQTLVAHGRFDPGLNDYERTIATHQLNSTLTIPAGAIPLRIWYRVNTAFASGGAATLSIGLDAGGSAVMLGVTAYNAAALSVANHFPALLTAVTGASPTGGSHIIVVVAGATLTAGMMDVWDENQPLT